MILHYMKKLIYKQSVMIVVVVMIIAYLMMMVMMIMKITMIMMMILMINREFGDDSARVARLILSSVCEREGEACWR